MTYIFWVICSLMAVFSMAFAVCITLMYSRLLKQWKVKVESLETELLTTKEFWQQERCGICEWYNNVTGCTNHCCDRIVGVKDNGRD